MTTPRAAPVIGLWLALVFPSLLIAQKLLGWWGVAAYAGLASLAVWWWFQNALGSRLPRRPGKWAIATFLLVTIVFIVVYPRVNTHADGLGSDDDDANNIGAMALIAGRSPYRQTTYLENPLHQLPGAFIVALPFVLLGTSAIQNVFWLAMFFLALRKETGNDRSTLTLAWLILVFSPTVMHQVTTGTGHAANTIYVLLGLWWLLRTPHTDLAAIVWGVALASRANFLLNVPIAFGALQQRRGFAVALRATVLTLATAAVLVLPFYFHDPTNFGPLQAADRLLRFNALIPRAGEMMLVAGVALALFLARTPMSDATVFRNCALVQAVAPVAGAVLGTVQRGAPDVAYATYGSFFAWFAVVACAAPVMYQSGHKTPIAN